MASSLDNTPHRHQPKPPGIQLGGSPRLSQAKALPWGKVPLRLLHTKCEGPPNQDNKQRHELRGKASQANQRREPFQVPQIRGDKQRSEVELWNRRLDSQGPGWFQKQGEVLFTLVPIVELNKGLLFEKVYINLAISELQTTCGRTWLLCRELSIADSEFWRSNPEIDLTQRNMIPTQPQSRPQNNVARIEGFCL